LKKGAAQGQGAAAQRVVHQLIQMPAASPSAPRPTTRAKLAVEVFFIIYILFYAIRYIISRLPGDKVECIFREFLLLIIKFSMASSRFSKLN
jgi:hypothetical protein